MREQRRLIHLFAPLLPQFRQRLPLFPEGDMPDATRYGRNFQVVAVPPVPATQIRLMSRWIAPDQEARQAFTPSDPRSERIGVVVDVVDDKAGAGQRAPEDRQKIDQERSVAR